MKFDIIEAFLILGIVFNSWPFFSGSFPIFNVLIVGVLIWIIRKRSKKTRRKNK